MLSREHHGPRAVLHALERLAGGYGAEIARVQQDLAVAEAQLRDYQARIGQPFAHDGYLLQLTALRDQLKAGLSGATAPEGESTVPQLAEQIKALRAAHTVEAAPERTSKRRTQAEEPITARIRRRAETPSSSGQHAALQSEDRQGSHADGAWQRKLAEEAKANTRRVMEPC
jgi:hypothetical protein